MKSRTMARLYYSWLQQHESRRRKMNQNICPLFLLFLASNCALSFGSGNFNLKSHQLCNQCSVCDSHKCPPSESYPHMTAYDDTLIAGASQSDFVHSSDRGVYSVPSIKGGESAKYNSYFGWESSSGSASGYHRFRNYMDRCSNGESYLSSDKNGKVKLRSLESMEDLGEADWKSINPPNKFNHREFRFWVNRKTGKCLTVSGGNGKKRKVGVSKCKFDGSNPYQFFAFRFHYHKAFCCCGLKNE